MSTYRAVIFDLDGTVVDSHRYTFEAFRFALAPFRQVPDDAEIFAAFGPPERTILSRLLPAGELDLAYGRLQHYYATHVDELRMHPAMRPLLHDCRAQGRPCGLFTGRGSDSTRLLLDRLDLGWAFDARVSGDEAVRPKPAPDGVRQLLAALRCEPGETLVVGDSPLDCAAATAAGASARFATWHAWAGMRVPDGVASCSHPDELRPLLGLEPSTPQRS